MRTISYKLDDLKKVVIPIGYEGENDHTRVIIDAGEVFKQYPAAAATLKVKPPHGTIYPVVVSREGDTVIWDVKETDCASNGTGEAQFTFTENSVIVKSMVTKININRSLVATGPAPDPIEDWLDNAEEVLDDLAAMDNIAKTAEAGDVGKALSPKTVENGVVTEWQYVEPGGGTEDYTDLENKPQIGGVELSGDKSLHDLGIAAESAIPDVSGKANLSVVAPAFDQATANDAGSLVTYTDGVVYVLPEGHTAGITWANTQKTATNIAEQQRLLKNAIDGLEETVDGTLQTVSEPVEATLTNGYLINANKNDASYYGKRYSVSNAWQVTGFVNIEKYESIKITAIRFASSTDAGIVFYSDNNANNIPQNCIDGFTFNSGATTKYVEERTFEKPSGAKYIRTSFQTSFDNFAITGYYKKMQGGLVQDVEELIVQSGANTKTIKEIEYNRFDYAVKAIDFDDGVKTDDQIIADALALLSNFDKKTLIFDTRDWLISEAILLEQNTTVYIDGVKIKQADETFDNVFRGKNFVVDTENPNKFALSVSDTQNIKIIGLNGAKIEGPTTNATIYNPYLQRNDEMVGDAYGWRAFQIYICNCNGLEIAGLQITKTRSWAMSFEFCQNVHIHDIDFDTGYVANGDGIDLRIGCHHFNIHDITGYTKDDTVACSALYPGYNNSSYPSQTSKSMFPCVASKTGESLENTDKRTLDVHDVIISNIYTSGSEQCVRCLCNNGIRTYNVGISNVIEDEDGTDHFQSVIEMSHDYGSSWSQDSYQDGDLNSISANNVEANGATRVLNCKGKVQNVYMNKLVQSYSEKAVYYIQYMDGITITNTADNP